MGSIYLTHGGTVNNTTEVGGYLYGIDIYGGIGTVTNSGTITGYMLYHGIGVILKNGGSVTNNGGGYIFGSKNGVSLLEGGTITNAAGAKIEGLLGAVSVAGAAGAVANAGMIDSSIYMSAGGSVTNFGEGQIKGPSGIAIKIYGSLGTVTNSASISATTTLSAAGAIWLPVGGAVVNLGGGTITGYNGVYVGDGGTITNAGTITGTKDSVQFGGSGANTLALQTGSVLNGAAQGSAAAGATNALALDGAGTANNAFLDFDTLSVQASGIWTLGGVSTIASTTVSTGTLAVTGKLTTAISETSGAVITIAQGAALTLDGVSLPSGTMTNSGTVTETAGSVTLGGAKGIPAVITNAAGAIWDITGGTGIALGISTTSSIDNLGVFEMDEIDFLAGIKVAEIAPAFLNGGKVRVAVGKLDLQGPVTGTGSDAIEGASVLEFDSTVAKTQTIDFAGKGGQLDLGSPTRFAGAIQGFDTVGSNNSMELLGAWKISGYTQTTAAEGTLTLTSGTLTASLAFDGAYTKSLFEAVVSSTQTTITYA